MDRALKRNYAVCNILSLLGGLLKLVKRNVLKTFRPVNSRHGGSNPSASAIER